MIIELIMIFLKKIKILFVVILIQVIKLLKR